MLLLFSVTYSVWEAVSKVALYFNDTSSSVLMYLNLISSVLLLNERRDEELYDLTIRARAIYYSIIPLIIVEGMRIVYSHTPECHFTRTRDMNKLHTSLLCEDVRVIRVYLCTFK